MEQIRVCGTMHRASLHTSQVYCRAQYVRCGKGPSGPRDELCKTGRAAAGLGTAADDPLLVYINIFVSAIGYVAGLFLPFPSSIAKKNQVLL